VLVLVYRLLRTRPRMRPNRSSKIGEMNKGREGCDIRLEMILLRLHPPIYSLRVSWSRSIAKQEQQRHRILCLIVVSVVGDMIEQILVFTPV
jgi:hypothetical protein